MSTNRALFFAVGAFAAVCWIALLLVFGSLYRLPPLPVPSEQPVFSACIFMRGALKAYGVGEKLCPSEILAHIGKGGMGDVYIPCDTRLACTTLGLQMSVEHQKTIEPISQ